MPTLISLIYKFKIFRRVKKEANVKFVICYRTTKLSSFDKL